MNVEPDDQDEMDATEEQLTALRGLGVPEAELEGLSWADADEWIDELQQRRRDAGKYGPSRR